MLHIEPSSPLGLADLALHAAPLWAPALSLFSLVAARLWDARGGA
jgi:hypothetical protein